MRGIKKSVYSLSHYSVPQDFSRVKLNQNESPVDIPKKIKYEVFKRLNEIKWNLYPPAEPNALIEKIADYTEFPSSGIIVGNGSNEMIQTLLYAFCDSGDKILTVQPGFSVYKRVASVMNIKTIEVPLKANFEFDVDAIIEKGNSVKLIILASPNNPTGTVLTIDEIEKIANSIACIVAVDEAYYEFYKETAQGLIHKLKNVIVLRTFSKALNLAGARLGYLLGRENVAEELYKARLPFSVGIFQQVAGEVVLENIKFVEENVENIMKERERLYNEMNKLPNVCPVASCANFILFEFNIKYGKSLYEVLYERGFVLRKFETPRLESMLRVTVGTREVNDLFLKELKNITEGIS